MTVGFGVDWPVTARVIAGLALAAANGVALRSGVLLAGHRAVRALRWQDDALTIRVGPACREEAASLRGASFRLGTAFLVLWFETRSGARVILVDAKSQDPLAFRRLCRRLARGELIASNPKV